ncbi:MAG: DUF1273 family protein [Oscillospiraceae bacterium]|nr:DUF1273 family protein [Oscillospiraceae bacterium]
MAFKICSFSGHRQIYKIHSDSLPAVLSETVDSLIRSGVSVFQSGGAMGFDLLAAKTVLEKKSEHPEIQLRMLLPCRDQAARWPEKTRQEYESIVSLADEVSYVTDTYDKFCMQRRNFALVDSADILLCYLIRSFGGTMHTVNYAYDKNLQIINLASLLK